MSEQEFNTIFSKNLNHYLATREKTQIELAKYVGVSATSVSYWCNGTKIPRMDKVDKICSFFMIKRSDLMYDHDLDSTSPANPLSLAPDEEKLLESYRVLNDLGKRKVREYAFDLTQIPSNIASGTVEDMG